MITENKFTNRKVQLFGIVFLILLVIGLNFYMLNKVISSSENQKDFEKNIKI